MLLSFALLSSFDAFRVRVTLGPNTGTLGGQPVIAIREIELYLNLQLFLGGAFKEERIGASPKFMTSPMPPIHLTIVTSSMVGGS